MISPFRGSVVLTGFVLAIPVLLMGMRGDFSAHEVVTRLLWCLAAGWIAVTVVIWASTPPPKKKPAAGPRAKRVPSPDAEQAPTA